MRPKIIVGNWKMNPKSSVIASVLVKQTGGLLSPSKNVTVVLCPPVIYIPILLKIPHGQIMLGAQDVSSESEGAFTGQISASMLQSLKVKYCIVGHSERRALGESDELIGKKIVMLLKKGITPIFCIGETERTSGHEYVSIVRHQIVKALALVPKTQISRIIFAYEPVWALSSTAVRHDATPNDAREMAVFIRKTISDLSTPLIAKNTRVIYGGSSNETNAGDFLSAGGIDGLLPGKASLSPKKFAQMVRIASEIKI